MEASGTKWSGRVELGDDSAANLLNSMEKRVLKCLADPNDEIKDIWMSYGKDEVASVLDRLELIELIYRGNDSDHLDPLFDILVSCNLTEKGWSFLRTFSDLAGKDDVDMRG